jgi:hypothetical protein
LPTNLDRIGEILDEKNDKALDAKDSRELASKPRYYEEVNTGDPVQIDVV